MRRLRPDVPVVLATGRPDAIDLAAVLANGWLFLRKPYRPSELVLTLRRLLPAAGSPD